MEKNKKAAETLETPVITVVKLKTKDHTKSALGQEKPAQDAQPVEKEFKLDHALAILKTRNSQWEIAETDKFKFDGNDISHVPAKDAADTNE